VKALSTYPPECEAAYFYGCGVIERYRAGESEEELEASRRVLAEKKAGGALVTALGQCCSLPGAPGVKES